MAKKRTKRAKKAPKAVKTVPKPPKSDPSADFVPDRQYVRGEFFRPMLGAKYRYDYDKLLWEAHYALPATPEGNMERLRIYQWYCTHDLFFLIYFGMEFTAVNQPWIIERCKDIETNPNMTVDLWAREHFKSSLISIAYTVQCVLRYPEDTNAIFSHSRPAAKDILRSVKTYLESPKLISWFPNVLWQDTSQAPSWGLETGLTVRRKSARREATVEAWGLVEGMPVGKHFNRRVIDDLVDPDGVATPDQINKTREAFQQSHNLGSSTVPGARDERQVVGTPYSWADLYSELEKSGRYLVRKHTVYGEDKSEYTVGRNGVLLNAKQIEQKLLDQAPYIFACQQLMNPTPEQQQKIHPDWIQYYQITPSRSSMNVYIVGDPANTKKSKENHDPDYTSMWVFGACPRGFRYLLDGAYGRFSLVERWTILKGLVEKWEPKSVGWERYSKDTETETMRLWMDEQNFRFDLVDLGGLMNKTNRINKWLIPRIYKKKWLLPTAIWVTDEDMNKKVNIVEKLINEQVLPWPLVGHDDLFDNWSRAEDPELNVEEPFESQSMTKAQENAALAEIGKQYAEVPGL
jgi:hypothetical protein